MKIVQFPYTIMNGELAECERTVPITKNVDMIGIRTADVIFGLEFVETTALYVQINGNSYGNESMTVQELSALFNECCISTVVDGLVSEEDEDLVTEEESEPIIPEN